VGWTQGVRPIFVAHGSVIRGKRGGAAKWESLYPFKQEFKPMASPQPVARTGTASVRLWIVLACGMLGAAAPLPPAAWAQSAPAVRVRGSIERVEGPVLIVKSREGDALRVKLAPGGAVSALVPAKLSDITAGKYIGVAGAPLADGSQKALEIHIFADAQRGLAEGFQPWDLQPESTMTNANVEAIVSSADGRVLTLKYKGGEKRIVVPESTPIVAFAPGAVSDLQPGAHIFVGAAQRLPDGTLETARITVGKGIAPPM
jgi:hypothetical protein